MGEGEGARDRGQGEGGRGREGKGEPEHDGFDPLSAFSVKKAQSKGAGVARKQRLPKLVSVIRGSIAGIY
jgi:hypothetical protein